MAIGNILEATDTIPMICFPCGNTGSRALNSSPNSAWGTNATTTATEMPLRTFMVNSPKPIRGEYRSPV